MSLRRCGGVPASSAPCAAGGTRRARTENWTAVLAACRKAGLGEIATAKEVDSVVTGRVGAAEAMLCKVKARLETQLKRAEVARDVAAAFRCVLSSPDVVRATLGEVRHHLGKVAYPEEPAAWRPLAELKMARHLQDLLFKIYEEEAEVGVESQADVLEKAKQADRRAAAEARAEQARPPRQHPPSGPQEEVTLRCCRRHPGLRWRARRAATDRGCPGRYRPGRAERALRRRSG